MGGTITVVWRDAEGSVQSWAHHTNPTPYRINRIEMCEQPSTYLEEWFAEEAKHDEFVKGDPHAMLGRLDSIYPISYGLIVIDQVTKQIMHCQGYTNYGTQHVVGVGNSWPRQQMDRQKLVQMTDQEREAFLVNEYHMNLASPNRNVDPNWVPPMDDTWSAAARLRDMVKANRLLGMSMWDDELQDYRTHTCEEVFGVKHPTVQQVFAWVYTETIERETYWSLEHQFDYKTGKPSYDSAGEPIMVNIPRTRGKADAAGSKGSFATFMFDMSPWLISRFDESPEGLDAFKEQLLGLGFDLNEGKWEQFRQRWDNEEE